MTASLSRVTVPVVLVSLLMAGSLAAGPDVNNDGRVDILDVQMVVAIVLNIRQPEWPGQGDVNRSGAVTSADVQAVANEVVGLSGALAIPANPAMPVIYRNHTYSFHLSAFGGRRPHAWSYIGELPPGMAMASSGHLSGMPTTLGTYPVTFSVVDEMQGAATVQVNLNVIHFNLPPVALDDSYTYSPGVALIVPPPGVLANDTDPENQPLTATVHTQPTHGVLTLLPNGGFTYVPAFQALPPDSFVYTCDDGQGGTATATVYLTGQNNPPVALPDAYRAEEGVLLQVPAPGLLANDTDPDGHTLTAVVVTQPQHGTVVVNLDGSFVYTPPQDIHGIDTFTYQAADGWGGATVATVRIFVAPEGEAPPHVHATVSPNPAKALTPISVTVAVFDPPSNFPATNAVAQVRLSGPGLPQGGTAMQPNAPISHGSIIQYTVPLVAPATWGLHVWTATVVRGQQADQTTDVTLAVYTGDAVLVGPTRTHLTIQAGLAASQVGDCVLVDPGTYYANSLTLTGQRILAGAEGFSRTQLNVGGAAIPAFATLGPTRETILMGIEVMNGTNRVANASGSFTVYQSKISGFTAQSGHGGAFLLTGSTSLPLFRESVLASNTVGDVQLTWASSAPPYTWGGAVAAMAGATPECHRTTFRGNSAHHFNNSYGGAIFRQSPGPVMVIDRCRFIGNISRSGINAFGGAIQNGHGDIDVSRSRFRNNVAQSVAVPSNETFMTNGTAFGGVLNSRAEVGTSLTGVGWSNIRFVDCTLLGNSAEAPNGARGGCINMHYRGMVRITDCRFRENMAFSPSNYAGGGVISSNQDSVMRFEHCLLEDNEAGITANIRQGGAIYAGPSYVITDLFDCQFTGNKARQGGAVYSPTATVLVADQCHFAGNIAFGNAGSSTTIPNGGAVLTQGNCNGHFEHCTFVGNTVDGGTAVPAARHGGGAIAGMVSAAITQTNGAGITTVRNCIFVGNSSTDSGGAIFALATGSAQQAAALTSNLEVDFSTFSGNMAAPGRGDAISATTLPVHISSTILWNEACDFGTNASQGSVRNSNFAFALPPQWQVSNNISANPMFGAGPLGGFYLATGSPCIDAALFLTMPPTLLNGTTTSVVEVPDTGNPDMGYHYPVTGLPVVPRTSITWQQSWVNWPQAGNVPVFPAMPPALVPPVP